MSADMPTADAGPAVTLEHRGALALVTMNRPGRANVIDDDSGAALADIARQLGEQAASGRVRAVLLQARGAQFCAGGDIAGMVRAADRLGDKLDRGIPALHDTIHRLATLPVPVVSAVGGAVGGGGIGLALCADIVLAGASMKLRGGYTAIGLTPDVGASWFLTRRVGAQRAKYIFMSNRPVNAQQALAWGLVCDVLPDAELADHALALADSLAAGATAALGRVKTLVDGAMDRPLAEHLALEHRFMVASGRGPESAEGVRAFIAKRAPDFGGT